ncbi:hypothetical protein [Actinacidiphila oryziradicis]|uniref:Uncharacterized protein n=1 Tax=Actinacidiphila oryziradicis TaxID=2571141 RepID=A0A4U0SI89_9ACTN|nr:hypothetical protein [Actinacidiphila oryziradicis]TKA09430.1 hypothetical protein FCI23_22845 [Actinacidiphila oryziradicis]
MSDDGIEALMRAASRIKGGEAFSSELLVQEGVPVALRLVLAAAVLTASDRPVNKKLVTATAPAARSATYRDHAELLEHVTTLLPTLVQAQLDRTASGASVTDLARQLQEANRIIQKERELRQKAELERDHVASYARELHWKLRDEYDAIIREKTEKVRHLRPLPGGMTDPLLDDAP